MNTLDQYLLKLILPEFLIEHFDLLKQTTEGEKMHLYFEEKSSPPQGSGKSNFSLTRLS